MYSADAPSTKQTMPPTVEQPVADDLRLEREQHEPQDDQQQPRDVERQAAEADEREDERERAQDAGDEVRVLELEQQPVDADREQHERDVRVGQQVEQAWNGFIATSVDGAPSVSVERPAARR